MGDDRPLYVLASRAAVILGVPLLDGQPNYPADPVLRATRNVPGQKVTTEAEGAECLMWLEFGRGLDGGRDYQLIATNGKDFRRIVIEARTPKAFRSAFDAWERGSEAEDALRSVLRTYE